AAVDLRDMAVAGKLRLVGAEPHGAAEIALGRTLLQPFLAHPFGDDADHRLVGRAELGRGSRLVPRRTGAFDAGHLHAQADAEERHLAFAREADAGDLAFRTALPEPAGDEDGVHRFELGGD